MSDRSISKFLSLVLRHAPSKAGLTLDQSGWIDVDDLLIGLAKAGKPLTKPALEKIVAENDKKRFSFSSDGKRIRAAQGHSVRIDLDLSPTPPPSELFHGTATRFMKSIRQEGLTSQSRRHVHLSADIETARKVGQRHGDPIILKIRTAEMQSDGIPFFQADNGVWLTDYVSPKYFTEIER